MFMKEDNTYNDIREKSLMPYTNCMIWLNVFMVTIERKPVKRLPLQRLNWKQQGKKCVTQKRMITN